METITIVGAGVAGMTAAISLAEAGAPVVLFDARSAPGGRARSLDGPYRANLGPHVLYKDGAMFRWLGERELLPPIAGVPLTGLRLRWGGELHRTPPLGLIPAILKLRGRRAPADESFRAWAARHTDERTAELLSSAAGVFAFHHDPGALSAAFVWERTVRTLLTPPPSARYPRGGWQALVDNLDARVEAARRAAPLRRARGRALAGITIVATEPGDAGRLLGETFDVVSGHTLCVDLAVRQRRGDPFVVSDLDECGWIERFTAPDPSLAPDGRGAGPGADPDPAGGERRRRRGADGRPARRRAARPCRAHHVAAPAGDGRSHGRARPPGHDLDGPPARSRAATASSSPATGSPRPACSARWRGRVRSRRAAPRSRSPPVRRCAA